MGLHDLTSLQKHFIMVSSISLPRQLFLKVPTSSHYEWPNIMKKRFLEVLILFPNVGSQIQCRLTAYSGRTCCMHIFVSRDFICYCGTLLEVSTLLFCILILPPDPETLPLTLLDRQKKKTQEYMNNIPQKKVNWKISPKLDSLSRPESTAAENQTILIAENLQRSFNTTCCLKLLKRGPCLLPITATNYYTPVTAKSALSNSS